MLTMNYSVVAYPVSYHVDTFKENKPSFENKMCFGINTYEYNEYTGEGRGGLKNHYVWALLDWRGSITSNRRVIYNSNNGPLTTRLTRKKFKDWLNEMKNIHEIMIDITEI